MRVGFSCPGKQGALLYLPLPARREDTLARGDFAKYITKNIDSWYAFARELGLGINRMEDIVLVTGHHRARSWISAAFPLRPLDAQVSFEVRVLGHCSVHLEQLEESGAVLQLGPSGEVCFCFVSVVRETLGLMLHLY